MYPLKCRRSLISGLLSILLPSMALAQTPASTSVVRIEVLDATDHDPIVSFEYCTKPGSVVVGTLWDTRVTSGQRSITVHFGFPSDWMWNWNSGSIAIPLSNQEDTLFVRAAGYEIGVISFPNGRESGSVEVVNLRPVHPISGLVVGPNGKGIANAPIVIGPLPFAHEHQDFTGFTDSAAGGRFTLEEYPLQFPLILTTFVSGFGPAYAQIEEDSISDTHILQLCDGATMSGSVHLSKGSVTRGSVRLDFKTEDGMRYGSRSANLGRSGKFSFSDLPSGLGVVNVSGSSSSYFLIPGAIFSHSEDIRLTCGELTESRIEVDVTGD